ncbi:MAG: hypothetical protein ACYTFA_11510, partial [Planctomycetota bacterium]
MSDQEIKRALISVYDKAGVVDFARVLIDEFGVEIISTGGTAGLLEENGISVTLVDQTTGFPEMMDGRVKTLHPMVHAAILADRDNPEHLRQLNEQGIEPIDMVVVNLYPFEKTVADPTCTFEHAIEMIDIGGPCLLRAAAKNHKHVLVIPDAEVGNTVLEAMRRGEVGSDIRLAAALRAYQMTCAYDAAISEWLSSQPGIDLAGTKHLRLRRLGSLRYGENPHQQAELFRSAAASLDEPGLTQVRDMAAAEQAMSFNNYVDATAALDLCKELTRCSTGFQPVEKKCGTGFQPVKKGAKGFAPLSDERHTWRNLPHIQTPGKTYFLTFRLKGPGEL